MSHYTSTVAPAAALENIGAPTGMLAQLARRLRLIWPARLQSDRSPFRLAARYKWDSDCAQKKIESKQIHIGEIGGDNLRQLWINALTNLRPRIASL